MLDDAHSPKWTRLTLSTLMHALALSPADAASLLPHNDTQISALLRKVSLDLHNPPHWTAPRHARAVLKSATSLSPPPKQRRKKAPPAPKHRISVQLIPATPQDDALVRAVNGYPFVEVVLKAGRRVWDVMKHLYQKWGLPVRVEHNGKVVSVDSLVAELVERGHRTVRLPYRIVRVDIDWRVLKCVLEEDVVAVSGKRRILAPRDDEDFWTGQFDEGPFDSIVKGSASQELPQNKCVYSSQESAGNGEQAVMNRLRGHLEKLDRSQDEGRTVGKEVCEEDPAIIPERFLRTCSRFEFGPSLPNSLLSLGKSDKSGDGNGGNGEISGDIANNGSGDNVANNENCSNVASSGVGEAEKESAGQGQLVAGAGSLMLNDSLDLRHELDLRCDEELDCLDFLQPVLDLPPSSLSLSTLFGSA